MESTATTPLGETTDAAARKAKRAALDRLVKPSSIAIVGVSDTSVFADYIGPTLDSAAEVFFVHPKHPTVFGRPTVARLSELDRPIDAVATFTSAARTVEIAEEAADLDVGGLVLVAGGFAEVGGEGVELQRRLAAAADRGGMAVIGPNGLGYVNVPRRVSLTIASRHKRRPGGISVVSQSGAMLSGVAMAAWEHRGVGLNVIISAGNEAATDLADYVDYFVADPDTRAIGLVIEKIRRPAEFFAAARRAVEAGKPIVALKLARNARSQQMALSHTASLTGDAWVYDIAFRQAGIGLAYDPEELIDRLQFFDQIEPRRWTQVQGLAAISMTGGFAGLTVDLAAAEGVDLSDMNHAEAWVRENIPGVTVPNPLDATGLGARFWDQIVDTYVHSPEADALLYINPLADEDASGGMKGALGQLADAAKGVDKPFVAVNCSGTPAEWTDEVREDVLALGRGLRPTLRGLQTLGMFVRHRERAAARTEAAPAVARPAEPVVAVAEGRMLPFGAAMELLGRAGIPTAPYYLVAADDAVGAPSFAGPYVVKLADVGHRTEHGAVRLGVAPADLPAAVAELRALAADSGLPATVAVQRQVTSYGEAFIGIQGASELGPLVVFGLGGIFVEVLRKVGGRIAPFTRSDAEDLLTEFADTKVMDGFRGQPAWDRAGLADILVAAGRLAAGGFDWIDSIDINPLIYGPDGFVAVDALCLLSDPEGDS